MKKQWIAGLFAGACLCSPFSILANEESGSEDSEIRSDLGFDVDEFYADTLRKHQDNNEAFDELGDNYGNLDSASGEQVYLDYLSSVNRSQGDVDYYNKLDLIQNSELGTSDPTMAAAYNKAKGQVNQALADYNLSLSGDLSKASLEEQKAFQKTWSTLQSRSTNSETYSRILSDYQNNKEIASYSSSDLSSLKTSPLTASRQQYASFKSIDSIYQSVTAGSTLNTLNQQYQTRDVKTFSSAARKAISNWVEIMTQDGEALSDAQDKDARQAASDLNALDQAIQKNDDAAEAQYMERISNFMIRHKIELKTE